MAIRYAVDIAKKTGAKITLFHVYRIPLHNISSGLIFSDPEITTEVRKEHQEKLNEIKEEVPELSEVNYEYVLKGGVIKEEIISSLQKYSCDLIVMGTKGARGMNEMLSGSMTASLTKSISYPLMVIPESDSETEFKPIHKITFAYDNEKLTRPEVEIINEFSRLYNAEIEILIVSEDKHEIFSGEVEQIKNEGNGHLQDFTFKVKFEENNDVEEGIRNYIRNSGTNLVALIRRKHRGLEKVFHKSITKNMILHTNTPLIILPE